MTPVDDETALARRIEACLGQQTGHTVQLSGLRRFPVGFSWRTFGMQVRGLAGPGDEQPLILRLGSDAGLFAPYSCRPEVLALRSLEGSAVPVPRALWHCDDEYARSQTFGVINLLNTFKVRADWSAGFLLQQIEAQQQALRAANTLAAGVATAPVAAVPALPQAPPVAELLALRDEGNRCIGQWLDWLQTAGDMLDAQPRQAIEAALCEAMRKEVELELRHSPRPLFAEMSGAAEA